MTRSKSYDLVVIGGGPAGSSAACKAAQLGLDVLLLEKKPMPRIKVCAGAVSAQALGFLGAELPPSLIDRECFGARVSYHGHSAVAVVDSPVAVLVRRENFDHFLVRRAVEAGAEFRVDEALDLKETEAGLLVQTHGVGIRARAAILAHGSTGRLTQKVRRPDSARTSGVAVECRLPPSSGERLNGMENLIDIHFGVAGSGYGWIFHHGDYCSVGIGGPRSELKQPLRAFHSLCRQLNLDVSRGEIRGHLLPRGGIRRKLVTGRTLLAGDAAGFVDPFLGEGIAYAIRSGQLASETVAEAMRSGDVTLPGLKRYETSCAAEFGRDLRYALLLSKCMQKFPRVLMKLMATNPKAIERYLAGPLSVRTYRNYLCWLVPQGMLMLVNSLLERRGSR